VRDASYFIALFGALFLGIGFVAWLRIFRQSDEQLASKKGSRRSEPAARAIVVAFLLCLVAAFVGVVGWIRG